MVLGSAISVQIAKSDFLSAYNSEWKKISLNGIFFHIIVLFYKNYGLNKRFILEFFNQSRIVFAYMNGDSFILSLKV